jgi:ArsR family metal-binding transcriptional regulator
MLTGSELMKRAQLAEIERLKKITELANQTRRNEITNRAFERLGITTRHPMGDLVLSMVRELANQNLNTGEIVERLNDNETVLESRRLHKEKRRILNVRLMKVLPSAKRPVLICGKCSPTWPEGTVQRIRLPQTLAIS